MAEVDLRLKDWGSAELKSVQQTSFMVFVSSSNVDDGRRQPLVDQANQKLHLPKIGDL